MMKKVLAVTVVSSVLAVSSAFAAVPMVDYKSGDILAGLSFRNMSSEAVYKNPPGGTPSGIDWGSKQFTEFFVTAGLDSKYSGVFEYSKRDLNKGSYSGDSKILDFAIQTSMSKNANWMFGVRNYQDTLNTPGGKYEAANNYKLFAGLSLKKEVKPQVEGYFNFKLGFDWREWIVGGTYEFNPNLYADLSYKSYTYDVSSYKIQSTGWGLGLAYKF